ncbi:endonuclease/exonuclease/phosphatase family protein [Myroides odoratus]|uniref:endonuclease/exonuclease/phosphatase family protein n=1 Tax=Myroides odoratus TaxID=256 RepID=UPI0039B11C95
MNEIGYKYLKKVVFFTLLSIGHGRAQEKQYQIRTIAFYNCENLFDTLRNPEIYDGDWTPNGSQAWTKSKYEKKIKNLALVMAQIGRDENPNSPTIIGVAEVENRQVLEDLIRTPVLQTGDYGIVHFDSPDKRGIDVGLLYAKKNFVVFQTSIHTLYLYTSVVQDKRKTSKEKRIYTRDQLLVSGLLDGEEIHFIVNHWPSRVGGEKRSSPYREAAAALNMKIIDSLQRINPQAKIITMGDMNDGPFNRSIKKILKVEGERMKVLPQGLFNPMEKMAKRGFGTLAYRDVWDIFDQVILTEAFLQEGYNSWRYWKARIFQKPFMIQSTGQYKGYPLRNNTNEPGFSDHFPVYVYLIRAR